MKKVVIVAFIITASIQALANNYSTVFPDSENPLSQGGVWINGQTNGGEWHNCVSQAGHAYGTMPTGLTGNAQYSDAACVLTGIWGPNQSATGTVYVSSPSTCCNAEIELHLNMTISANYAGGYEFNCSTVASNPYLQIVRWNGPLASYASLALIENSGDYCKNGDILNATNVNGLLSWYKNGQLIISARDTTFSGGSPGIGFYNDWASVPNANWGFSSFSATDGGSSGSSISLKLTPTTSQTEILKAQVSSSSGCGSVTNWTILASISGSTYTDSAVTTNDYYCYTAIPILNGLFGQPSATIECQATASACGILSAPATGLQITTVSGTAVN